MDENKINHNRDILLVYDKKSGKMQAVAGIDENGKIKTVKPSLRNDKLFMTVDKNSNDMKNFFKDFTSRNKNPADTEFYKTGVNGVNRGAEILETLRNNHPDVPVVTESCILPQDYVGQKQEQNAKVLLTQGEDGKLKAVTGMEQNGKLNTVDPTKENSDKFLEINPNGNVLENFMKKFSAQYEKPSHTGLYAVTASAVVNIAAFLDKIIKVQPDDKVLDPYRVQPDGQQKELSEGQQKYQALDLNKVDWKDAEKLGIPADSLADTLKAMAYGHKSPGLVDIKTEIDGKEYSVKARLSLEQQPDGSFKVQAHPKQKQPDFEKPFMGVTFTKEDIEQFEQTGNGGRVFDLEHVSGGEKVPSLISLDKLTNRFEAVELSEINIPQKIKGAELSAEQQEGLKTGKGVLVEGMDKRIKAGEEPSKIDRILQYNASNRNFDFRFTPEQREQHRQDRQAKQGQEQGDSPQKGRKVDGIWINPVQGGVKLTDEQFNKLLNKQPVFIEGMQKQQPKPKEGAAQQVEATDKKGQKYNAWVWPDAEAGRVRHTSKHPDEWKVIQAKKATPAESHKTQVAVNNDGKTNEATKHSNEPLKPGQSRPTEKQAEKKAEKQAEKQSPKVPKKGGGRKVS